MTYTWNSLGLPENTTYSDGTPPVSRLYDRSGRLGTLVDAAGTHTYSYPDELTVTETINGGALDKVTRSALLDSFGRLSSHTASSGSAVHSVTHSYRPDSRLDKVFYGNESAIYSYAPNSDAIGAINFKSSATTRLWSTRTYDASERLSGVSHQYSAAGGKFQSYGVTEFDSMDRRKKIAREDGTRWDYGYNNKGEATSAERKKTASGQSVPGWSFGYDFDEIGNRKSATTNGRTSIYTANSVNEVDTRSIPRAFDILGKASPGASVAINGQPAIRLDEWFSQELSTAANGSTLVPYSVSATDATGTTTRSGGKFLPATPETFGHDDDGNLTSDGRFIYTWDAENRLIAMETHITIPLAARRKLKFSYDAMGRRISKTVWHGITGGGWQLRHKYDFIHEINGWNILAERPGGSKDKFIRTYAWGIDLSGSMHGAGGVGGLLFTTLHTSGKTFANGMDLNGNVTLLVNTADGEAAATYDYGAFGEPLRQSGEYANLNPYRFSTKYTDQETGLLDYGHRHYNPETGRWLSRDPIEERGGINLYGFVNNGGVNFIDKLGQARIKTEVYVRSMGSLSPFKNEGPYHQLLEFWGESADANPTGSVFGSPFTISSPALYGGNSTQQWTSTRIQRLTVETCCIDVDKFKEELKSIVEASKGKNKTVQGSNYYLGWCDCRSYPTEMVSKALRASLKENRPWGCGVEGVARWEAPN